MTLPAPACLGLLKEEPSISSLGYSLQDFSHLTRFSVWGKIRGLLAATDKKFYCFIKTVLKNSLLLLWPSEGIGCPYHNCHPMGQLVLISKQASKKNFNAQCSITENKIFPNPNEDKEVEASASVPIIDTPKTKFNASHLCSQKSRCPQNSSI